MNEIMMFVADSKNFSGTKWVPTTFPLTDVSPSGRVMARVIGMLRGSLTFKFDAKLKTATVEERLFGLRPPGSPGGLNFRLTAQSGGAWRRENYWGDEKAASGYDLLPVLTRGHKLNRANLKLASEKLGSSSAIRGGW